MKTARFAWPAAGFTLLEVMIAMGIFFMTTFVILDLVSQNLRAARAIKPDRVDISSIAADLFLTNRLYEGTDYGDFGEVYPGYSWARDIRLVSTNGLFQVDFVIMKEGAELDNFQHFSLLLFRPESQMKGGLGSGVITRGAGPR